MQRRKLFLIAVALMLGAQFSTIARADKHRNGKDVRFTVRVENVSSKDGQMASDGSRWPFALSPGMWVIHNNDVRLFDEKKPAPANGLEAQAEDGNPEVLIRTLEAYHGQMLHGLFNTPVGKNGPGPIGPGDAYEFSFSASAGMMLNLMLMFGQSNDWFYAADRGGIALFDKSGMPVSGDVTSRLLLWDAGTEINQEPGVGADQAPRQKAPNTGAYERDVVRKAKGSPFYSKTSQLFRITVTPQI
jgi:hypothetical protein